MGRIKTQLIKRTGKKLYRLYKERFTPDFDKNKVVVQELVTPKQKKMRNVVAGYITHLVKENKD